MSVRLRPVDPCICSSAHHCGSITFGVTLRFRHAGHFVTNSRYQPRWPLQSPVGSKDDRVTRWRIGSRAIDPKGLKGERGFDYANLFCGSSDRCGCRPSCPASGCSQRNRRTRSCSPAPPGSCLAFRHLQRSPNGGISGKTLRLPMLIVNPYEHPSVSRKQSRAAWERQG
ncbi:aminoglycoside phosphotransferase family protein [Mesorhizobium caraganae]|uniref:aminoglycoside phosphotransferase family protein n=1 Tax=Mesorhizobium caraganae TaxID=483206 RepID=UPI0035E3E1C1